MLVPVIDIQPLLSYVITGSDSVSIDKLEQVGQEIDKACSESGFFYITNYTSFFAPSTFDNFFNTAQEFFLTASKQEKLQLRSSLKGYFGINDENTQDDELKLVDMKEGIRFNWETAPLEPSHQYHIFENSYPCPNDEEKKQWRAVERTAYNALVTLGKSLLVGFAVALKLPPTYFFEMFSSPLALLQVLHYPPLSKYKNLALEANVDETKLIGCGAHTDYGFLTLLKQDSIGGLEIFSKETNEWTPVPFKQDSFVVNIGDAVNVFTNSKYKATRHRVVIKSVDNDRFSMPFFFEPNYETPMQLLPNCQGEPHDKPVKYGDYLTSRFYATFSQDLIGKK